MVGDEKVIDLDIKQNQEFIDQYCLRNNKTFDITRIYSSGTPSKKTKPIENGTTVRQLTPEEASRPKKEIKPKKESTPAGSKKKSEVESLAMKEMRLKVKKLENENRYKELQIEKLQGMLIPTELASHISLYAIDVFQKTFTQNVRSLTNVYAQRLGANHTQFVNLQKALLQQIQNISQEAKDSVIKGIEGAIKEYSEIRSRGEKKLTS